MTEPILRIENFSKDFRSQWTFKSLRAVSNVSLEVSEGECFGFLGHNGAGKTTTIKCILGLIHKTAGEFYLNGKPLRNAIQRETFGFLPEQPYFYEHLTVEETLNFFGALHNIPKDKLKHQIVTVLERVGITDRKLSPVRTLSKGLQQRLGFAQAMINNPKFLFLDEPFSGLDPVGRMEMRELISELNRNGVTIFLSSHILSDVENMCSRAAIMKKGVLKTVVVLKDKDRLYGSGGYKMSIEYSDHLEGPINTITTLANKTQKQVLSYCNWITFSFDDYKKASEAMSICMSSGVKVESFARESATLEEVFIKIVKED